MNFNFYDKDSILSLFREKDLIFQKRFGQNFLIDEIVINKIISRIENQSNSKIVEIGCGIGNITSKLLERYYTIGFEIDKKFCGILKEIFKDNKNFYLIEGDFLKKFNKDILKDLIIKDENIIVFGAIPYYITTDIIEKLLLSNINIKDIYLIIQEDVLDRILAKPRTKDYGYLTILIKSFSLFEVLFKINRDSFFPVPQVDSVFVRLNINNNIDLDKNLYSDILKNLFNYRRKSLKNTLNKIKIDNNIIEKLFNNNSIDKNIRLEELNYEEIYKLIKTIINFNIRDNK